MPESPSPARPLPPPSAPMTPALRAAYSRLVGCMRGARTAAATAAAKAAAAEEARAEYERLLAAETEAA